jgi:tetratricopeptide (TPR) repeat protein
MISRLMLLVAVFCLAFLGACGHRAGDQAARLAAEASRDMVDHRFENAFQKMERAADLRPDVAEYHVGLGMAAARLGIMDVAAKQYASAEGILARQAEHDPERVDDYAMVVALLGRTEEAKGILTEGLRRFPDSPNLQKAVSAPDAILTGTRQYSIRDVERDGPANGSQPIHSMTNSTSSVAGSRR